MNKWASYAMIVTVALVLPATAAQSGQRNGRHVQPRIEAQHTGSIGSYGQQPRDPAGILRGDGVSSLYGGMGNMGGGSGRSANTGVGLGAHGNSQGLRH